MSVLLLSYCRQMTIEKPQMIILLERAEQVEAVMMGLSHKLGLSPMVKVRSAHWALLSF